MANARMGRDLNATPTWAVALVSAIIVVISILLEKVLHKIGETFEKRNKKALVEALEKIKAELMVLGFISLLLTFGQNYISKICITEKYANTMLPCPLHETLDHNPMGGEEHNPMGGEGHQPMGGEEPQPTGGEEHQPKGGDPAGGEGHQPKGGEEHNPTDPTGGVEHQPKGGEEHNPTDPTGGGEHQPKGGEEHHRRLLFYEHRILSGGGGSVKCKPGHVPVISVNGLHQLHIFIFFLAVCHVIFGAITMTLGRAKIRGWKIWEQEEAHDYEISNDPSRFRLTKETSFVKDHTSFMLKTPVLFYVVCFYRQFFRSVRRHDYLTMRHGFISVHLVPGSKFDFQKYIKRSLEDDFKVVVGISPVLWASAVIFLLFNVHGWAIIFWLSCMPLFIILAVGTKLQAIIAKMAVEIQERHAVVQGIPLVQVSDKNFWFGWPRLVLYLIHLTLFQNAFEITHFIWITYEFGLHSCFHENFSLAVLRVAIGLAVEVLCSYITLPLYALVTQMGSTMKQSIFDDQTSKALKNWTKHAKKNTGKPAPMPTQTLGGAPKGSPPPDNPPVLTGGGGLETTESSSANITASVDITPSNNASKTGNHDLLTGP